MNTMNNANEISLDLKLGFAWAHDGDESKNFFQVCIQQRKDLNGFKKEISSSDCGWDDGLCGDYNDSIGATKEDLRAFLKLAKKSGIKVI